MLNFFTGLREVLARTQRTMLANIVLGAVVRDAIRTIFIPRLENKLKRATGSEREQIEELIELYEEYGDERSGKGRMYDAIAVKTVMDVAKGKGLSMDYAEQLAQDMVGEFYADGLKAFNKFKEESGPLALGKYWKATVSNMTKYMAREFVRQQQTLLNKQESLVDSEGNERGPLESLEAPLEESDIDRKWLNSVYKDLVYSVRQYAKKKEVLSDVFETWLNAVNRKGSPDKVNVLKDVANPLMDKGYKQMTVYDNWKKIQREMVKFLENEDIYLTDRAKKKLKIAESVAYEMFRRRLSRWVLQDIDSCLF